MKVRCSIDDVLYPVYPVGNICMLVEIRINRSILTVVSAYIILLYPVYSIEQVCICVVLFFVLSITHLKTNRKLYI